MNKDLNQAVMVRLKLRHKFLRVKAEENGIVYVSQRSYCVNMLHRKKKRIHQPIQYSVTDNKLFWKTTCPSFTNKKLSKSSKITLLEKGEIVTHDAKMHPSLAIAFSFENMKKELIEKKINDLERKKTAPQNEIPVKILKLNADFVSPFIS